MKILSCLRPKNVRGLVALFIYKLQQIYSRFRKLRIQLKDHNESFIFHEKKSNCFVVIVVLHSFKLCWHFIFGICKFQKETTSCCMYKD